MANATLTKDAKFADEDVGNIILMEHVNVQIDDQPDRGRDEGEAEERPLAPNHREKDLAVPHFSEPQPVCVVTEKRRSPEEHEESERQKSQTKRRFHWYLLPAASRSA